MDQVCWVSLLDASESNVRHASRVVAAVAGAEERVFFHFFKRFRRDVREFCCRFWTPFRHEIRWCFAVSEAPVRTSFCTYFLMAQKVTLDTAACGLELPKALLASLRAMVFCCFASACQEVILDLCF